jgi:RNA polymerase sigma-70 factor (ECF subfamily)
MATVARGLVPPVRPPLPRSTVRDSAKASGPSAEEARLARQAAAGDGDAFAALYGRYEQRAYNLCYRILGSEDDAADATQEAFVNVYKRLPKLQGRELAFGSYVFTSARNACYDLIERRRRAEPSDQIPESSIPVGGGVGGGGVGFDPGDPEDDPERRLLLAAGQEEIRAANATLPERQREVLALRELEELSYDEIAEIMEMNRNSVAQLISRARISLRDALRGTALASVATSSAGCERAVALLAARQDRQGTADGDWLTDHLVECETCRLSREAMEEAGVSYRAWLPIAAAPFLFRETMASAAEAAGEDWSDVIARHEAAAGGGAAAGAAGAPGARASLLRHRRRDAVLIALIALVLVVVVFAGATGDDNPPEAPPPVADEVPAAAAGEPRERKPEAGEPGERQPTAEEPKRKKTGGESAPAAANEPAERSAGGGKTPEEGAVDTPSAGSSPPVQENTPPDRADRGTGRRGGDRGGDRGITGGSETPAVEPPPPPPPPPPEPPISDTPPDPPQPEVPRIEDPAPPPPPRPACRDAQGIPIPCPPTRPEQGPPRLAPPRGPG